MQNVPEKQPVETDRSFDTHMAEEHGQNRPVIHREREREENMNSLYKTLHPLPHRRDILMCLGVLQMYTDVPSL